VREKSKSNVSSWASDDSDDLFDEYFIPYRFAGQYADEELSGDIYYNRFRYYDPQLGQYITQDPIGLEGGNPTLYGYVGDPNTWIDPFGLAAKCEPEHRRANNRQDAQRMAQRHSQVPRNTRGGRTIGRKEVNEQSRGPNWGRQVANGQKIFGRENTNPGTQNSWELHPDGHPHMPGGHHDVPHIHATSPGGTNIIITWH